MKQRPAGKIPLAADVEALLATRRFGRPVRAYASIPSTNAAAARWAAEGAEEGSVVVAEYQTAGRGRFGRAWTAQSGQNLTFSLVLRPALPPARLGLVALAAAVGVSEALDAFVAPLAPAIKWPNDLLLCGRKCCGMLLESAVPGNPAAPPTVVLGVGLNVNQDTFAAEMEGRATSLLLEVGRPLPRAALLARLLLELEEAYLSLLEDGSDRVRERYEARLLGLGQPITLHLAGGGAATDGVVRGVTPEGALRLQTSAGLETFHAGEVTTRPAPSYR